MFDLLCESRNTLFNLLLVVSIIINSCIWVLLMSILLLILDMGY